VNQDQDRSSLIDPARSGPPDPASVAGVAGLLALATGEDEAWAGRIGPDTLLESDLGITSLELAELNVLSQARYGGHVDLVAFLGTLDIDQIIELTVGDLLAYLVSTASVPTAPEPDTPASGAAAESQGRS
jgi:acyl carrier protein